MSLPDFGLINHLWRFGCLVILGVVFTQFLQVKVTALYETESWNTITCKVRGAGLFIKSILLSSLSKNPPKFRVRKTHRQSVTCSDKFLKAIPWMGKTSRSVPMFRSTKSSHVLSKMIVQSLPQIFDGQDFWKKMQTLLHLESLFRRTNCLVLWCLDGLMFCWHFGFQVRVPTDGLFSGPNVLVEHVFACW